MGVRIDDSTSTSPTLVFDAPDRLNALTRSDMEDASVELQALAARPDLRTLRVRGEGRAFCSGADRTLLAELPNMTFDEVLETVNVGVMLTRVLATFPVPTISLVRGAAYGGGACLALACDEVVVSPSAQFGFVFTDLALPGGDMLAPWLLARRVGTRAAWSLLANGAALDAESAIDSHIADALVDDDSLERYGSERAAVFAGRPAQAVRETKRQIMRMELGEGSFDVQIEAQMSAMAAAFTAGEFKPGGPNRSSAD